MDVKASDRQNKKHTKRDITDAELAERRGSSARKELTSMKFAGCYNCANGLKQCSPEERYLTKSPGGSQKRSQRKSDHKRDLGGAGLEQEIDEDMLHVLVTRPEIASKPRDNIVFEGDMDLKTTFETSYENLAKMRLGYWKQRQQAGGLGEQGLQQEQGVSAENSLRRDRFSSMVESSDSEVELDEPKYHKDDELLKGTIPAESNPNEAIDGADGDAMKLSSEAESRSNSKPSSQPYIDPDLSSIIVYDANMNRLEKVGVRKRSKYRPSTSLRTGARGLFGDQSEERIDSEKIVNASGDDRSLSGGSKVLPNDTKQGSKRVNRELAMSMRNLNSSKQANHLTYSARNLPVDSKRKLKDNVNMRDHIKEQDICARHNDERDTPTTQKQVQEHLENLRLAQQEEDAAVEELQRCLLLPAQDTPHDSLGHKAAPSSDVTARSNQNSRQSRLERTCQNQSFYLFENDYPEQKQRDGGIGSATSIQVNRHPVSYKNLFRESPDFILATRGHSRNEQKSPALTEAQTKTMPASQSDAKTPGNKSGKEVENDLVFQEGQQNNSPAKCRVLRLDEDFQYVGSQGGHNYFTERQFRSPE